MQLVLVHAIAVLYRSGSIIHGRVGMRSTSRAKPFLLTTEIYGGDEFSAIEPTPQGLSGLKSSLEFAAVAELGFGDARGVAKVLRRFTFFGVHSTD
jgi:hypothetical protein